MFFMSSSSIVNVILQSDGKPGIRYFKDKNSNEFRLISSFNEIPRKQTVIKTYLLSNDIFHV